MQGNIKRMLAENSARRQVASVSGSTSAGNETSAAGNGEAQQQRRKRPRQSTPGDLFSGRFGAAEARRANTRPTFTNGVMVAGGQRIAELRDQHTRLKVNGDRCLAGQFWQRALPCTVVAWDDKKPELKRQLRNLLDTPDNVSCGFDAGAADPKEWRVASGFGACVEKRHGQCMHCLCTEPVGHLHLVQHKPSGTTVAVGSSCVRHFAGDAAYKDALRAESTAAASLREAAKGTQNISAFLSSPRADTGQQSASTAADTPEEGRRRRQQCGGGGGGGAGPGRMAAAGPPRGGMIDSATAKGLTNHRPKESQPAQASEYKVQWMDRSQSPSWVEHGRLDSDLIKVYTDLRWAKIKGQRGQYRRP